MKDLLRTGYLLYTRHFSFREQYFNYLRFSYAGDNHNGVRDSSHGRSDERGQNEREFRA